MPDSIPKWIVSEVPPKQRNGKEPLAFEGGSRTYSPIRAFAAKSRLWVAAGSRDSLSPGEFQRRNLATDQALFMRDFRVSPRPEQRPQQTTHFEQTQNP